jgi:PadR family transcriptional regulator, regulatory protein PadR
MEPGGARTVITQLRRGVVEHCVLALLRDRPRYGFDLVRELSEAGGLLTSEGTIYPLLARLRRDGLVVTSWQESTSGPPRRYYALSDDGRASVAAFVPEWTRFKDGVDRVLGAAGRSGGQPDRGCADGAGQRPAGESRGSE